MANPHVHAALIKAWADGAEIEVFLNHQSPQWTACPRPNWYDGVQYRVKPMPHKWQREMDAFKAGKIVQWRWKSPQTGCDQAWHKCVVPSWNDDRVEFRVPPESVVLYWFFNKDFNSRAPEGCGDLKLTFEDGVLVAAEVLK